MRKLFLAVFIIGFLTVPLTAIAGDSPRATFGSYKIYMFLDLKTGALCYMNYQSISCQHYSQYSTHDNKVGDAIQEYKERGGGPPHIVIIGAPPEDEKKTNAETEDSETEEDQKL